MSQLLDVAQPYWEANADQFVEELKHFLRFQSISTLPDHAQFVRDAGNFLVGKFWGMGIDNARLIDGNAGEHPLVVAEWMHAPGAPTVLLYCHYDVQPVDPLNEWFSPPFAPEIRGGKIYARGAADSKGHVFILLKALEGYLKTSGKLPINVKVLFEGEEETNGANIGRFVHQNPAWLADVTSVIVLDADMYKPELPTICSGLRGIVTAKLTVRGTNRDLHSGIFGGAAPNAIRGLFQIGAALHTAKGRVAIPGFYDSVTKPAALELKSWKELPFSEDEYRRDMGATALMGDRRYSVQQRLWGLPTVEFNGIVGGFVGQGEQSNAFKTVLPAKAVANISMRLVPGMDPNETALKLVEFVQSVTPADVTSQVEILAVSPAMLVDVSAPAITAAATAFSDTFHGESTAFVRCGGSVPIAGTFASVLKKPVLITGFALPDANMHSPDESLDLWHFRKGIEAIGRYFDILEELSRLK